MRGVNVLLLYQLHVTEQKLVSIRPGFDAATSNGFEIVHGAELNATLLEGLKVASPRGCSEPRSSASQPAAGPPIPKLRRAHDVADPRLAFGNRASLGEHDDLRTSTQYLSSSTIRLTVARYGQPLTAPSGKGLDITTCVYVQRGQRCLSLV